MHEIMKFYLLCKDRVDDFIKNRDEEENKQRINHLNKIKLIFWGQKTSKF